MHELIKAHKQETASAPPAPTRRFVPLSSDRRVQTYIERAPIQTLVTRYVGSTRQRRTEVQGDKQQARIAAQK